MSRILLFLLYLGVFSLKAQKKSIKERASKFVNEVDKELNLSPTQKAKLQSMTENSIHQFDKLEATAVDPKTEKKVSNEVKDIVNSTEKDFDEFAKEEENKPVKTTPKPSTSAKKTVSTKPKAGQAKSSSKKPASKPVSVKPKK
jgi:outer membrane biosynthesis protein TonB